MIINSNYFNTMNLEQFYNTKRVPKKGTHKKYIISEWQKIISVIQDGIEIETYRFKSEEEKQNICNDMAKRKISFYNI